MLRKILNWCEDLDLDHGDAWGLVDEIEYQIRQTLSDYDALDALDSQNREQSHNEKGATK